MSQDDVKERLWRQLATNIDNWLLPAAGSFLCMLLVVQVVTGIPSVRQYVDAAAGRFVQMPKDVIPASVSGEQATVSLYAAPEGDYSQVQIQVNGQSVGTMASDKLDVQVREGDVIQVFNGGNTTVFVSVDHNNPNLLVPAPGQTITVDAGQTEQLPSTRFIE